MSFFWAAAVVAVTPQTTPIVLVLEVAVVTLVLGAISL